MVFPMGSLDKALGPQVQQPLTFLSHLNNIQWMSTLTLIRLVHLIAANLLKLGKEWKRTKFLTLWIVARRYRLCQVHLKSVDFKGALTYLQNRVITR